MGKTRILNHFPMPINSLATGSRFFEGKFIGGMIGRKRAVAVSAVYRSIRARIPGRMGDNAEVGAAAGEDNTCPERR